MMRTAGRPQANRAAPVVLSAVERQIRLPGEVAVPARTAESRANTYASWCILS